ncbi:MAG: hypothetical protein GXO89_05465 [Chlorobi bacterium]|nr:hypothetical protein [Chlorobiota bacterium]
MKKTITIILIAFASGFFMTDSYAQTERSMVISVHVLKTGTVTRPSSPKMPGPPTLSRRGAGWAFCTGPRSSMSASVSKTSVFGAKTTNCQRPM